MTEVTLKSLFWPLLFCGMVVFHATQLEAWELQRRAHLPATHGLPRFLFLPVDHGTIILTKYLSPLYLFSFFW